MRILDFADGFESSTAPELISISAALVSVDPSGNLSSTDGQSAFEELQGDIDDINSSIGQPNGIASLDGGGKVPIGQLPNSIMEFQGIWDASTNTPTLADGSGDIGDVYRVDVAGSQNLGSGSISFVVGDWIMYNGTIWQKAHAGADVVLSVFGRAGIVVSQASDYDASQIDNTPSGNLSATDVQGALDELQTDIDGRILKNTVTTKGDLLVASASSSPDREPVGSNGQVLTADSTQPRGVKWASPAALTGGVTYQIFTSGSGTYTTPGGVSYIKVKMVSAGGGGGGSRGVAGGSESNGSSGGNTSFGSSLLTCTGGGGGRFNDTCSSVGAYTINSPAYGFGVNGTYGGDADGNNVTVQSNGGDGGDAPFFSGGGFGGRGAAGSVSPNSGGGGGGGGAAGTDARTGSGGGSGAYIEAIITSPSATYSYSVGAGGAGGNAGTSGFSGGSGADGIIIVEEYY